MKLTLKTAQVYSERGQLVLTLVCKNEFGDKLTLMTAAYSDQVKILNSLMKDKMAEFIKTTLNSDIPYVPWLTG